MMTVKPAFQNALRTGSLLALGAWLLVGCTTTTTVTSDEYDEADRPRTRNEQAAPRMVSRDYVVERGDTLYSIAFRQRVDLRELIAWNRLAEPYTIYPGQRLRIETAPAAPPRFDNVRSNVVASNDTTARTTAPQPSTIARGPLVAATASATAPSTKSIGVPTAVAPSPAGTAPASVASMPAIPIAEDGGVREATARDEAPGLPATSSDPVLPAAVAVRTTTVPVATPLPQTPTEPIRESARGGTAPSRTVGGIGWRWPSTATLVGRFAADDEARQGIRLQAATGTIVNASADGEVVYSGNGLVGLGELVIIKHGSEYLSAYGLNRKRLVTEGQKVRAGDPVAEMGSSAGVAGLLHFEVRRGGRPIDPLGVLPPR